MDEDLERIRRSLAMSPSLPGNVAADLLAEVGRLRRERRDLVVELDEIEARVRALRTTTAD